jgi:hypothetical protein
LRDVYGGSTPNPGVKIKQTVTHFAAKQALELPGAGAVVRGKLVDLHTDYFLDEADESDREARREHLEAFFDASLDVYLAALDAGYPEAEAREITHVIANFDFYTYGWYEMMEFPPGEIEAHMERYAGFFAEHDISVESPLGEFAPEDGLPDAPEGEGGEAINAEGGFEDDTYVEDADGNVKPADEAA